MHRQLTADEHLELATTVRRSFDRADAAARLDARHGDRCRLSGLPGGVATDVVVFGGIAIAMVGATYAILDRRRPY